MKGQGLSVPIFLQDLCDRASSCKDRPLRFSKPNTLTRFARCPSMRRRYRSSLPLIKIRVVRDGGQTSPSSTPRYIKVCSSKPTDDICLPCQSVHHFFFPFHQRLLYEKSALALRTFLWQRQTMHLSRFSPILILIPGILSRQVPPNLRAFYDSVKSGRCNGSNLLQGGFQDEEDGPKGIYTSVHLFPPLPTSPPSYPTS